MGGVWELPWWGYIVYTLVLTQITIVSVTVYLHRCQSHRAIDLHPALAHFFRFWLWLTTSMITSQWVAVHRKHHARVETPDDPHSPQIMGLRKVLLEGVELYRIGARDKSIVERYRHGTPDDWLEREIYDKRFEWGPPIMLMVNMILFGPIGISIWAVQMLWIPIFAAGVINGIGHYFGYRNYETPDASRNIIPWGFWIGGEELHNNHHAFPSSAKFSTKWWEFDIGWLYIQIFCALGLARVKKRYEEPKRTVITAGIDHNTVRAVVMHRLHIMARYAAEVINPVFDHVIGSADNASREAIKRVKGLMSREYPQLGDAEQTALQQAVANSSVLETVYRHRLELTALFTDKMASYETLWQALVSWCEQAEASGIAALAEFARSVQTYTVPDYERVTSR